MTTLAEDTFKCSLCGKEFEDAIIRSTNTLGGQDSDFRTYASGIQPIAYYIHTCPFCGYTDYEENMLSSEVKDKIEEYLSSYRVKEKPKDFSPSQKYAVLANILVLRGRSSLEIADVYLKAAWMADDEKNNELSGTFREKAITFFEKALKRSETSPESIPTINYLVGELNRCLEKFDKALKWFSKVETEDNWLQKLCGQQKQLVLKKNSGKSRMPIIEGNGKCE